MRKKGSREEVWQGIAIETTGGLKKKDLMISKTGTLVSKKASQAAKKRMKKGDGLCGYCIEQYKKTTSEKKEGKEESKREESKKSKKKESKKKVELKFKKVKGASEKKIKELQEEVDKMFAKASRIVERTGRETAESKKLLADIHKKRLLRLNMIRTLRAKKKK